MLQMSANRDKEGEEDPEPTRRTPPQLLEGYVDIDCWAKEYLRTQFGLRRLGDGVSTVCLAALLPFTKLISTHTRSF
jgi:hypothetical protein